MHGEKASTFQGNQGVVKCSVINFRKSKEWQPKNIVEQNKISNISCYWQGLGSVVSQMQGRKEFKVALSRAQRSIQHTSRHTLKDMFFFFTQTLHLPWLWGCFDISIGELDNMCMSLAFFFLFLILCGGSWESVLSVHSTCCSSLSS